jgi:ATP-binding cassette subfamily B multidrug efflux pump
MTGATSTTAARMNDHRTSATEKLPGLAEFGRRYGWPQWRWYLAGFAALAATNWITLEIPQLAKEIVNALAAEPTSDPSAFGGLREIALLIIGLGVFQIVMRSLSRILIFWPGRTIEMQAKSDLFARCLTLPLSFLMRFGMGDLISRLANDVGQLRVFFAFGLLQVANLAFLLVFTITRMASVHLGLTIAAIAPLALMLLVTRFAMPRMQKYSRENQEAIGRLTNRVTEAFVNAHVIQVNAAEDAFVARAERENAEVFTTNMKLVVVRNVIFPLMNCLAGLAQLTVLFYGGYEVMQSRLTVGDIMAFNVYIGFLGFPLTAVGMIIAMYQRAQTAVKRTWEIDLEPAESATRGAVRPPAPDVQKIPILELRSLTFRWRPDAPPVLENISFQMFEGEKLGIYGPIGSGKSTLFNLVTRVFDPPPGMVFWRGRDVLEIPPAELRSEIGYAQQTVHLFSDTVRANLSYGLPADARSEARLRRAAQQAEILGDIERFETSWETQIGEKGIRLSGGQKQRLALARMLARDSRLLILDDVMSAVDHETEVRLSKTFHSLGVAMLVATHRPSVLNGCDRVLMLDAGRVARLGPWREES